MDPSSRGEPILALSLHARNPYYYYVERAEIAASIKLYELPLPSETYWRLVGHRQSRRSVWMFRKEQAWKFKKDQT
jgi:hypothetical protein